MAIVVVMVGKEERGSLEVVVVYGRIKWSHEIRGNRGVGEWLEPTDALCHVDAIRARVLYHSHPTCLGHSQDGVDPLFSFTLRGRNL